VFEIESNAVYQVKFCTGDCNLFTALQHNLGNHKFKDDGDMQTVDTMINRHPRAETGNYTEQEIQFRDFIYVLMFWLIG
jgi:hypothetical protein